jgi:hypothetical protein
MIRSTYGFFIVLDHKNGIAEISHLKKSFAKTLVVSLVQTDARFIKNIKNAGQLRANLCRKPYSLAFPTGKRGC